MAQVWGASFARVEPLVPIVVSVFFLAEGGAMAGDYREHSHVWDSIWVLYFTWCGFAHALIETSHAQENNVICCIDTPVSSFYNYHAASVWMQPTDDPNCPSWTVMPMYFCNNVTCRLQRHTLAGRPVFPRMKG